MPQLVAPYPVQVLVDPALQYFREAALGARHYGFETGRLSFVDAWLPHELRGDLRALARRDGICGVVAPLHTPSEAARFARLGLPVVNISNAVIHPQIPVVTQDDEGAGRIAALHLIECGCRAFGFWGHPGKPYSAARLKGFRDTLKRAAPGASLSIGGGGERGMPDWLRALPQPAGVFTVLDSYALSLMRAARSLGRRVPDDVAVLGAGNDHFWVDFESIPLSSVRLPAWNIGYEAARLLADLIAAKKTSHAGVRLPVVDVAARQSTAVRFVEDAAVARAVDYIRAHAHENPYVKDVARAVGLSRTSLGARFQQSLGRTLLTEIQLARIELAKRLLRDSDTRLTEIAERCGFPNSQRFSVLFRQRTGQSPRAWRKFAQAVGGSALSSAGAGGL
ncbi:MAG: substrate-binding domain-containing protein [Opitutus sp.]|nr:substrate-binding domain-containing protein [Opitutus sp.]MCS6247178.1 substrate-binding domain-containing protein [Opitutus sp.]MCS6274079.1 substrate-binding domain-containing protein [Opitutus sp.]MCS6276355.1 substrate-binding domain-containing protein [Opitutus sp.]MCS6301997.1 substrate-binding domain-containing protein [Opitutus sp.]